MLGMYYGEDARPKARLYLVLAPIPDLDARIGDVIVDDPTEGLNVLRRVGQVHFDRHSAALRPLTPPRAGPEPLPLSHGPGTRHQH